MYEFKLPDVGEGIHEAVIANWLVAVGDEVKLDQPIVEIETDKALVEIPAPVAGTIASIPLAKGATAHVGDVLVTIDPSDAGTTTPKQPAPKPISTPAPTAVAKRASNSATQTGIAGPGQRILAAPAVRKRALEMGIDLSTVSGSAGAGRITMDDLLKFTSRSEPVRAAQSIAEPVASPSISAERAEAVEYEKLSGLRNRIAERMQTAWRVPHVTSFEDIAVKRLVKLRRRLNQGLPELRLTYLPFIVKTVVQILKEQPYFNASLDMDNERIVLHRHFHIGIATAIPDGLVVPVLRHAERLSLLEIDAELKRLGALARERRLAPHELTGSTFTITNYGSFGSQSGTPIINPPESAILGCGRIEEKAFKGKNGKPKFCPVLPVALSFDHRLHDGAAGAQFLNRLRALLGEPGQLLLHLR